MNIAKIAQLVEHDLAKVGVAGSSPVFRSQLMRKSLSEQEVYPDYYREVPFFAHFNCFMQNEVQVPLRVQLIKFILHFIFEIIVISRPDGGMVDTKDLKSFGFTAVRVQVPLRVPRMVARRKP